MKFTKNAILAVLLFVVCVFSGCAINTEATPSLPIPTNTPEETLQPVQPEYVYVLNTMKETTIQSYEARNQYGSLVKLRLDFSNSDEYGTDEIRKVLTNLLGNIKDEQYASDEMFLDFTNTARGDKVLFNDKYPLPHMTDLCDVCQDFGYPKLVTMAVQNDAVPSLDGIYVKQDVELLYLTDEQYDKIVASDLCLGIKRYSDYVGEKDSSIYSYDTVLFNNRVWVQPYDGFYTNLYKKYNATYFQKWYNQYVTPYIVE